ncbi:hypothetical protein WD019_18335 [Fictibacillus sp. Mic-4]
MPGNNNEKTIKQHDKQNHNKGIPKGTFAEPISHAADQLKTRGQK